MTLTGTDLLPGEWSPGWPDEFTAICDSNRGRLVRWLTAIFGPRDAEDIAQEALTRLYVRPGMLEDETDAWRWLSVVARNVGRDMMRHNAYSTTVESGALDLLPDDGQVHDKVVARDDAERLRLAMNSISPRDRALIRLRDVEGVSVAEIAAMLGLNDNAVRQQLFRARKRLANAYLALGGERLGLVALVGLRFREFMRRHGHLVNSFGQSTSGAFAGVIPVVAAIVGGALFLSTAPPVVTNVAALATVLDAETRHGVSGVQPPSAVAFGPAAPPEPPPESDPPDFEQHVGDAHIRAWRRDPLSVEPGRRYWVDIYVDNVPVAGFVHVWFAEDRSRGRGRACAKYGCPTALPTPPPAGR